jgi:hypothetical protein
MVSQLVVVATCGAYRVTHWPKDPMRPDQSGGSMVEEYVEGPGWVLECPREEGENDPRDLAAALSIVEKLKESP